MRLPSQLITKSKHQIGLLTNYTIIFGIMDLAHVALKLFKEDVLESNFESWAN